MAQAEGFVLEFCKAFQIGFAVMLCKILRSPFQNNTPCCFVHCVRIPVYNLTKKQEAPSTEDASRFLAQAEGFEPPWVAPNGFQDRLVMTTSITLRVFNFIKNRNPSQGKLRENCEKRFSQSAEEPAKNPIKSRVFKKLHKHTKEVFKAALVELYVGSNYREEKRRNIPHLSW